MMKRIRISGNDCFDSAYISCQSCNKEIIVDGEPMTPIYYVADGEQYCSECAHKDMEEKARVKHLKVLIDQATSDLDALQDEYKSYTGQRHFAIG